MWSIETDQTFPLASVKPLDGLTAYRQRCLEETRVALRGGRHHRSQCPIDGTRLKPAGTVDGLPYVRCPASGSLFLAELPPPADWARLLGTVTRYRYSPETFHAEIADTRNEHVYGPKLDWIRNTLRLQRLMNPTLIEVITAPSPYTHLLEACEEIGTVTTVNEMDLVAGSASAARADAAVMFESVDRVDDPVALVKAVVDRLVPGGLLFATALVASGFDLAVLGLANLYLYPPDRTNCLSLVELERLVTDAGLTLLEVSTPGVLDVEIVQAHVARDPGLTLPDFERRLLASDQHAREAFQTFLQQHRMSSFARLVARKPA